ncbi:hypothetical protein ALP17_05203 [Pseudomonas savastanoi]|uniref:Uncharacterized protein n=1 Tax=Pseudomonas savastanoi TaxID=29438 RepID=A0A3M5ZM34_PSESS|nr:hypothetical protein ALP17_05203 [Pseudomonas savastanoi]
MQRLPRLPKKAIDNRGIRIVSVDPPTSHQGMTA